MSARRKSNAEIETRLQEQENQPHGLLINLVTPVNLVEDVTTTIVFDNIINRNGITYDFLTGKATVIRDGWYTSIGRWSCSMNPIGAHTMGAFILQTNPDGTSQQWGSSNSAVDSGQHNFTRQASVSNFLKAGTVLEFRAFSNDGNTNATTFSGSDFATYFSIVENR